MEKGESEIQSEKMTENQVYEVITSRKPDWQTIIYDLINSEQLDPLNLDLVLLTRKYFEKIEEMQEADFYISSKVLLAAALLLRIKSEFLLNKYIKSIDEILFGRKEEKKPFMSTIQINEEDIPILIPKTPLPRAKRVTLDELMTALNKAINTEVRRIKREVAIKRAHKLSHVDIPEFRKIDLKDRIRLFYSKVLAVLKPIKDSDKNSHKVGYTDLIGKEKEEKLASFLPLLHLSNTKKLWLEQERHLSPIWIYLYQYFDNNRNEFIDELEKDIDNIESDFINENEGPREALRDQFTEIMEEVEQEIKKDLPEEEFSIEKLKEELAREEIIEKRTMLSLDEIEKKMEKEVLEESSITPTNNIEDNKIINDIMNNNLNNEDNNDLGINKSEENIDETNNINEIKKENNIDQSI